MTPLVFDDVLESPHDYRTAVLAMPRRSHELAPDVIFHGIAQAPDRQLSDWIEARFPQLEATMSVTRLAPLGQREPNSIHTDCDLGQWTGILYLNPDPPEGDGTTFYRERATGAEVSTAATLDERLDEGFRWRNAELWEPTQTVEAKFGRLVLFPSAAFHSRAMFDNYGADTTSARLIQIVFGTGVLP